MTVILLGAIIAVVGGLIGAYGTYIHNKKSSEKSTRIEDGVNRGISIGESTSNEVVVLKNQNSSLLKQADTLNQKIETQSQTIDELRKENSELYTKLANTSIDIYHNLTGGDSYCTLTIGNIVGEKNSGIFIFELGANCKNPLRNVQARIVDLNIFRTENINSDELFKNIINIDVIDPNKAVATQHIYNLDKVKGVNLNVFFSANNGFFTQLIRMRFVNNNWTSATLIERDGKTIFKKIHESYPEKDSKKIF